MAANFLLSHFIVFLFLFLCIYFLPLFDYPLFKELLPFFHHCFMWEKTNHINLTWPSEYILNQASSLLHQLSQPPLIWVSARLSQTVLRSPGSLLVSPMLLASLTTSSGMNRNIIFLNLTIVYVSFRHCFGYTLIFMHLHVSLFRYHPIDDEDDNTETSVDDGSNSVVLRSKSGKNK